MCLYGIHFLMFCESIDGLQSISFFFSFFFLGGGGGGGCVSIWKPFLNVL